MPRLTLLNLAINSGSDPKDRFWFGYTFRGGKTHVGDYQRDDSESDAVQDSVAYTTTKKQ